MAKHLQQLDLFGNDTPQPVHIAAPASTKSLRKSKSSNKATTREQNTTMVVEEPLPTVSRTSMHYKTNAGIQKRGRKSFASMEGDMEKIQVPSAEILAKKTKRTDPETENFRKRTESLSNRVLQTRSLFST